MKSLSGFIAGCVATCALFVCMGAGQPPNDYEKACVAVQAEGILGAYLSKDPVRHKANMERFEYWVQVMEKFKP